MTELQVSEDQTIDDENQIMEEMNSFYGNLYTSVYNTTFETFQELTNDIHLQIPKLSDKESDEIEGKLT